MKQIGSGVDNHQILSKRVDLSVITYSFNTWGQMYITNSASALFHLQIENDCHMQIEDTFVSPTVLFHPHAWVVSIVFVLIS